MNEQIAQLKFITREAAQKRMVSHSFSNDTSISETIEGYDRRVHGNWMAIILVSGKDVRITFKVHFNIKDIKKILEGSFAKPYSEIEDDLATDFVKEFCNLTAGYIKQIFEKYELKSGISLPIVTRGFDDIFYRPTNTDEVADLWKLEVAGVSLLCTPHFNIFDSGNIPVFNLEETDGDDDDDDGDIDFL
jgi:CheY-specific phosphatase CheX